jgi:hypothetical protein
MIMLKIAHEWCQKNTQNMDLFFVFSGVFTYLLGAVLARRSGGALNAECWSWD